MHRNEKDSGMIYRNTCIAETTVIYILKYRENAGVNTEYFSHIFIPFKSTLYSLRRVTFTPRVDRTELRLLLE